METALEDFSQEGYEGASLSTVFVEKGISKEIVYHHFKDKDMLYLLCVEECFRSLTGTLARTAEALFGDPEEMLQIPDQDRNQAQSGGACSCRGRCHNSSAGGGGADSVSEKTRV